jgi:dolichol-phosphate mannosyltransferase|tara:strand:+ start:174 stop:884 length:711 start_codon:yes stop_codon:yes gene_type:complete
MKNKILIIIPVLNEVNNILPIIKKIFKHLKNIPKHVLFIDDNSKDGTREKIYLAQKKFNKIYLIKRNKKLGIGSAHKVGLDWGFKKRYEKIITMDCDGTHDPIYINRLLKKLNKKNCQIVSTNRFLKKNSLSDWTIWRKFLTFFRHKLIQFFLNVKYDSSGAFRGYLVNNININDIFLAKNDSYSFFWESIFILSKKYKIKEIPIKLPGRLTGASKMRIKDILLALLYLIKIYLKK